MIESIQEQKVAGLTDEEAVMSAFQANVAQEKETISTNDLEAYAIRKERVKWEKQQDLWNILVKNQMNEILSNG